MGLLAKGILALGSPLLLFGCDGLGDESSSKQATLVVFPDEDFQIAGPEGGPFFPVSKVYLVSNAGDETLLWSAHSSISAVGFSVSSGALDAGESEIVTVFANPIPGTPPGYYTASIVFANDTTGTEEVEHTVALTVSAAGALEVSPTIGFSSSGPVGGPFAPLSAPYVLSNAGASAIEWSIEISEPWLSASVAAGQLQASSSQNVTLSIDPLQAAELIAANHVASVVFHDLTNASDFEILVTLAAIEPARLQVTPADGFSTAGPPSGPFSPANKTYTLSNSGGQLLNWQVTRNTNWVTRSRVTGSLAPGQQTAVVIGINSTITSSFADGLHTDTLFFTNTTNGLGDTTRPVDLTLSTPPAILTVSPTQPFSSAGQAGGPFQPASKTYTLSNTGAMTLSWQALASTAWLAMSPASGSLSPGASTQVVASIQQGVASALPVGQHAGQLTFTNLTSGTGNTTVGASLNISAIGGGGVPVLTPGSGFAGPTQEPGQIGSGTAKAIARWDVVPYQSIVEATNPTFTVGVVAFHIAGIARVSFSLQGGPFVDATAMTLNPQTGVWEYCATIDASDFASDQPIELRAIAYPNAAAPQAAGTGSYPGGGYPRLLDSMFLYVDADVAQTPNAAYCAWNTGSDSTGNGSPGNPFKTPWKAAQLVHANGGGDAAGGIVFMDTGDYTFATGAGTAPAASNRWLTFAPKPGVSRSQVRIASFAWPGFNVNKVRLHEVKAINEVDGAGLPGLQLWLDNVTCQGPGIAQTVHTGGWTPAWSATYWTDVDLSDDWHSIPAAGNLLRNVHIQRVQHCIRVPKLVVNCSWRDVAPQNGEHQSFISWNGYTNIDNSIVYGVRGLNVDAGDVFLKNTHGIANVALVNTVMQIVGGGSYPFGEATTGLAHFLMRNFTYLHDMDFRLPQSEMTNISIRGCVFSRVSIGQGGDSVKPGWFDQNHYVSISGTAITPGTNASVGDPQWDSDFHPLAGSLLRRITPPLMQHDVLGVQRPAAASAVGAYE